MSPDQVAAFFCLQSLCGSSPPSHGSEIFLHRALTTVTPGEDTHVKNRWSPEALSFLKVHVNFVLYSDACSVVVMYDASQLNDFSLFHSD